MSQLKYGTAEYYAEGFSDYLADLDAHDPATTENLIQGFFMAIDSWFDYHDEQARAYAELRKRVHEALAM